MPGKPVDIGTGHEPRITPGRATTDQLPLRNLTASSKSPAAMRMLELMKGVRSVDDMAKIKALHFQLPLLPEPAASTPSSTDTASPRPSPQEEVDSHAGQGPTASHLPGESSPAEGDEDATERPVPGTMSFAQVREIVSGSSSWQIALVVDSQVKGIVETQIWQLPDDKMSAMIESTKNSLVELAKDANGAWFVQRLYDRGSPTHRTAVVDALKTRLSDLLLHDTGHFVTQKIAQDCTSETRRLLLEAVAPDLLTLAQNRTSHKSLELLLADALPSDFEVLVPAIEANFMALSEDKQSSFIVQTSLQRGSFAVVEKLARCVLAIDPTPVAPRVERLAVGASSNYVLRQAMNSTRGALHIELLDSVARMLDRLSASRVRFAAFNPINVTLKRLQHEAERDRRDGGGDGEWVDETSLPPSSSRQIPAAQQALLRGWSSGGYAPRAPTGREEGGRYQRHVDEVEEFRRRREQERSADADRARSRYASTHSYRYGGQGGGGWHGR
ncbi:hypothetical protein JCM10450v2_003845 [Rhodotorula kratochvilovae]